MPELIIPRSAEERRQFRYCGMCKARFPMDQGTQWVRHVKACSKRHADELEAEAEYRWNSGIYSPLDREKYDWIRKGGN